jgi:hypothetical protein
MPITAAQAFEKSLSRRQSTPALGAAAQQFEHLLKAASDERVPAGPAPERLGRGTGNKDTSFEAQHPYLVHGNVIKVHKHGTLGWRSIPESHPDFDKVDGHVIKVNNPYERISRMGYRQMQEIGGMSMADQKRTASDYEHPNDPYHLAYHFKLHTEVMAPHSEHFHAALAKKVGGIGAARGHELINLGLRPVKNADTNYLKLPANIHELAAPMRTAVAVKDENGKITREDQRSNYGRGFTTMMRRGALMIAGGNRMLHVLRGHAKEGRVVEDPHEFYGDVLSHDLHNFSARRPTLGYHDEHLNSSHNPFGTGDFDRKGKPTGKVMDYFKPQNGQHLWGNAKLTNPHDILLHLRSVPVGKGSSGQKGALLGRDYITPAIHDLTHAHARVFED